ncbi:MAG: hypothetical protein JWM75_1838 [Sphingomonas bacterium]|nr:hypothetical protein [Sphingomonas bacterium]
MNSSFRALRRLLPMLVLPLLVGPLPASGATVRKVTAPAIAPKPVKANDNIIALPLTPIVPAAQRLCTSRTPSGLAYTVLRPASGPRPAGDATVLVNYIGYLATTGSVFDQGMRSPLPVGEVIPGFSEGLQMIAKSAIVRLCIPAAMGYGAQASGPIPANSDLVFQVELLDFKSAAEMKDIRGAGPASQNDAVPRP